ncbi:helix-turn-helix transcriptional regulator [Shewanella sp. NFH-SH190041]|uniref:helix-turn-helix transcriptional regulator n=1 Tax=Shewanella sp. NFH-SH190041 TaxID=2950245 RepID=UPI0021C480AE|nr:response regulator transcription factor [Shewanella sp. NFH-SH190041]BDM65737.1 helix-turn-helix transcriptional regulator [Shewanella sp. NFH-SH190041]
MDTARELIFLHQAPVSCHLAQLAESMGFCTRIITDVTKLDTRPSQRAFYFIAQQGAALDERGIPLLVPRLAPYVPLALYQVTPDSMDMEAALLMGVRGVLHADQRMDLQMTGLEKMLHDELWFDRPLLSRVLEQLLGQQQGSPDELARRQAKLQALTKRERTIVQLVASGARNKEIARQLSISEHTVKAHISSVLRKTQSRNRVELLRWAQQHIPAATDETPE